jgi:hypothetical protein
MFLLGIWVHLILLYTLTLWYCPHHAQCSLQRVQQNYAHFTNILIPTRICGINPPSSGRTNNDVLVKTVCAAIEGCQGQTFGTACVSHHQCLSGTNFRDWFCVPRSGSVTDQLSGLLVCPIIRVCQGPTFGTVCVSHYQGLSGTNFQDWFCFLWSGSVRDQLSGLLMWPITKVWDPDNGTHKQPRNVFPWPNNDAG